MSGTDLQGLLSLFSAPIRAWFEEAFGQPTPPQALGWPAIGRGEHTLILAPTGSGKTFAAFLSGIDRLYRELTVAEAISGKEAPPGVRIVYVSPLKALNNDIYRNLRLPLVCIKKTARESQTTFPEIRVSVRSGDTPQRERRAMVRRPPHILITTPESLYLLLTSPRGREMFRSVHTLIVDEIHTLVGAKRGVHLSLSLERLAAVAEGRVQRIGLSATIRPLEEAAHFLGGCEWRAGDGADGQAPVLADRPVTIIDTKYRKPMDLQVITTVPDFRELPGDSIWPSVIPHVAKLIKEHRSTLIFCNNRRLAERTADRLNEYIAAEQRGDVNPLTKGDVARGVGILAVGTGVSPRVIQAHHGSVSKEPRLQMEQDLKAGKLPALVATSSLELGIDIGSVDLVIQLQSPKSIAQGLQRIGRSGHLVGQTAKGRIFATHREDVMETAGVAGGMLRGEVEPIYMPHNPLDVLAQQVLAMVAVQDWDVDALYRLVRQAYAYRGLSYQAFHAVLEMLAGRYHDAAQRELAARLAWDRVNNRLMALPGSRNLAVTNGGTIPNRGAFGAYLTDGKTKLGELDEEFVFETRIGDVFMLGSQVWRAVEITPDRMVVAPAPGETARMPFWHGDYPWRPYELGREVGEFRRKAAAKLRAEVPEGQPFRAILEKRGKGGTSTVIEWLRTDYALDEYSAWNVVDYVAGQLDSTGAISSDRVIVVEVFENELGELRAVIQSPFGGRVNGPWGLALASVLRERTGIDVEVQSGDDGILLRFPEAGDEVPWSIMAEMEPAEARERILREMADSALFGARFRQNAARALLLPGNRPGKRTPFWLQRLKARDLLQAIRRYEDFPILIETYRDCLEDVMDIPHLEQVLQDIQGGEIQVVTVESIVPSPVAQGLLMQFTHIHMYEWDAPRAERQLQQLAVDRVLLQDLLKDVALDHLLRPEAIEDITGRLQHTASLTRARSVDELAVILDQVGDLSAAEIAARAVVDPTDWIEQLAGQGRIREVVLPTAHGQQRRWASVDLADEYERAFRSEAAPMADDANQDQARRAVLQRFLWRSGPVTVDWIRARYDFPPGWLDAELKRLVEAGEVARGRFTSQDGAPEQYLERRNLEQIHRQTLTVLRREVRPVPRAVYADFLAHWQHLHPAERLKGRGALVGALQQLRAVPALGRIWERDLLPLRVEHYDPAELEDLCQSGELIWIGSGGADPRRGRIRFLFRGEGLTYAPSDLPDPEALSAQARAVHDLLRAEGALFFGDIQAGLGIDSVAAGKALVELVMSGLVTNDSLQAMRQLVHAGSTMPHQSATPSRRSWSTLEAQLAERRGSEARGRGLRRPTRAQLHAARRRVGHMGPKSEAVGWMGRWSLVHRLGIMGRPLPPDEQAARQARQLLQRWGIVTHERLVAEETGWGWGAVYAQLRLMEMRGEVRRGLFVEGLAGLQFALPDAVEQLRARRDALGIDDTPVVMNAADPANLYGPDLPGGPVAAAGAPLAFARHPSTWLVQWAGWPVLVARGGGASVTTVQGSTDVQVQAAMLALSEHLLRHAHRVTVEMWNGAPVLPSGGSPILEALGFHRDYLAMTLERQR